MRGRIKLDKKKRAGTSVFGFRKMNIYIYMRKKSATKNINANIEIYVDLQYIRQKDMTKTKRNRNIFEYK